MSSQKAGATVTPDSRDDKTSLKLQKGNFVVVPIPISDPTLDTGLIAGGAYFYAQSEEQRQVQPASVTAAGAMYTSNDSKAFGIGHQGYWANDSWRFGGAIGHADLRLRLRAADASGSETDLNWVIQGNLAQGGLSKRIAGNWYAVVSGRFVDVDQSFQPDSGPSGFDVFNEVKSVGVGAEIEYDSRDLPINTYAGRFFEIKSLFNEESFGSDKTYQSYKIEYRSYYETKRPLVLAWELAGCLKKGSIPLWDACWIELRGFPVTDYLGKSSASAQFEARWRLNQKWGLVGFAGTGFVAESFSGIRENKPVPSYGGGIRFMLLAAKRINLRVDYARSTDSDAIHLAVGESF